MPVSIDILLIEDNPADAVLIQKIFEKSTANCKIRVVEDGELAMEILRDPTVPNPDLILLDINMPRKDGKQVLEELKSDAGLRYIPVIMLTSSKAPEDIMHCYDLGANSYVIKPATIEDHAVLLNAFDAFWLTFAVLPTQPR